MTKKCGLTGPGGWVCNQPPYNSDQHRYLNPGTGNGDDKEVSWTGSTTDQVFTYETTFTKIQLEQAGPVAGDLLSAAAKGVTEGATFAAIEAGCEPFFSTITVRAHVVAFKKD